MSIIETGRDVRLKRTYHPKPCAECSGEFIPTSTTQKYDLVCEPVVRARKNRERYNGDEAYRRRRIAQNYRWEVKRKGGDPESVFVPDLPKVERPKKVQTEEEKPRETIASSTPVEVDIISSDVLEVEAAFSDMVERLQKRKLGMPMPVFKGGEDGDGMQIYFSPNGYLCYRPIDKEFKIETDVAIDVYGKDKILGSLAAAVSLRKL